MIKIKFILISEKKKASPYQNNGFDRPLRLHCSKAHAIKRIQSSYSSGHRDRRFNFICSRYGNPSKCSDCTTTPQYVNNYRKPILFNCPANQVVAGVESVHNNSPEDRVWKFRCCSSSGHVTTNCELTNYINNLHGNFDYTVPGSKVVVGMYSTWVNK